MIQGKTIYDIFYAVNNAGQTLNVSPIWANEKLVKLSFGQIEFRILLSELYEDYDLLDADKNIIHTRTGEIDE